MQRLKEFLIDFIRCYLLGFLSCLLITVIAFGIGFFSGENQIIAGVDVAKNAGLFLVAISLFLIAGMLLVKGKKLEKNPTDSGFRAKIKLLSIRGAIFVFSLGNLTIAILWDAWLLRLNGRI